MLSLREIVKRFGATNTFIISKAGSRMAEHSRHWLVKVMAIEETTGFNPNNIYYCPKISGSRGKGRIAKSLGITHMVDDRYAALIAVYYAKGAEKFSERGQLFHMSPSSKQEFPEDRFIPVTTWPEVMARLNVSNHSYHS